MTERTQEEIDQQNDKAAETEDNSKYPGMSYEAGVRATLDWVTGQSEEQPMEEVHGPDFKDFSHSP